MANAAKLLNTQPVRMMLVGYPKAGKTGALAALANAGFKLRIIDFDANYSPLLQFTRPEMLHNIDIQTFEDKMRMGAQFQEPNGIPVAFANALKAMDSWKYTDPDGTETDLGSSKDWGLDTVLVVDGLTGMGDAAFKRAAKLLNKSPGSITQQVWMLAMGEQLEFVKKLTANHNRFHVILLSHLKMVGPKDVEKNDSDLTVDLKKQVASLVETKLFPNALGRGLPPVIGGEFPVLLLAEPKFGPGTKVTRLIKTVPRADLDLGVSHPDIPAELPLETGLLTIFEKLSPESVKLVSSQGANE